MANFNFQLRQANGFIPSRLSTKYAITLNTLTGLTQELNNSGGAFANISDNEMYDELQQYIYSIRYYPFDVVRGFKTGIGYEGFKDGTGSSNSSVLLDPADPLTMLQRIVIGDAMKRYGASDRTYGDGTLENGDKWYLCGAVMNNYYDNVLYLGRVYVQPRYHNFLDGNPFTKIEAYIPFLGTVQLDADLCNDKYVHCHFAVDFTTGDATVFITTTNTETGSNTDPNVLILQTKTQVGFDIPLGQTNATELARNRLMGAVNIVGGVATTAVGIATGNPAIPLLAGSLTSTVTSVASLAMQKQTFAKGTQGAPQAYLNTPNVFFITRTYSIPVGVDNAFNSVYGRPANDDKHTIGDYIDTGLYFKCADVHIDGIQHMTRSELEELEMLLKTGVIG